MYEIIDFQGKIHREETMITKKAMYSTVIYQEKKC